MENIFEDRDYLIWRLLLQNRNAMLKFRSKELALYGLTHRQAGILAILGATQGDTNAYRIAKWIVLEPHTVSTFLNRMEAKGIIKKSAASEGGRKTSKFELTDKGWEAYHKVMRFESIPKVLEVLTDEDRIALISILKKIRDETLRQIGIRTKLPYPPF
jgi:DNA-binding MarR family transcriptional regulator